MVQYIFIWLKQNICLVLGRMMYEQFLVMCCGYHVSRYARLVIVPQGISKFTTLFHQPCGELYGLLWGFLIIPDKAQIDNAYSWTL